MKFRNFPAKHKKGVGVVRTTKKHPASITYEYSFWFFGVYYDIMIWWYILWISTELGLRDDKTTIPQTETGSKHYMDEPKIEKNEEPQSALIHFSIWKWITDIKLPQNSLFIHTESIYRIFWGYFFSFFFFAQRQKKSNEEQFFHFSTTQTESS